MSKMFFQTSRGPRPPAPRKGGLAPVTETSSLFHNISPEPMKFIEPVLRGDEISRLHRRKGLIPESSEADPWAIMGATTQTGGSGWTGMGGGLEKPRA